MATVNFTDAKVRGFKYDPNGINVQRHWDTEARGLGVQVFKTGRRSWIHRYRVHGKQRIISLGAVNDMTLAAARLKVAEERHKVSEGTDPKVVRELPNGQATLDDVHDAYIKSPEYLNTSDNWQNNYPSTYKKYIQPVYGHYPIANITGQMIRQIVIKVRDSGKEGAARGIRSRASALFQFATNEGYIPLNVVKAIQVSYTSTGKRTAWLDTEDKLRAAWFFNGKPQARALIRWLLLTGCRRDEARTMTWDQISYDDEAGCNVWRVVDTKNGRDLVLPIMPMMQEVLDDMKATFKSKYVFPATTSLKKPIPAGSIHHVVITKADFIIHELRHTVSSYLAKLKVFKEVRDLITNHANQTTDAIYTHGDQIAFKQDGLTVWHDYLKKVIANENSNVIKMKRA